MFSVQNNNIVSQIIEKIDLEVESKNSEVISPEDDDEEFTPTLQNAAKKKTPPAVLPKRKGRPPKNL
jgi:hypothetical protein